jgi:hypothetical protein
MSVIRQTDGENANTAPFVTAPFVTAPFVDVARSEIPG